MRDDYERSDITGLYFIVGGLVVFAVVLGFLYMGNRGPADLGAVTPAAGDSYTVDEGDNTYYMDRQSPPETGPIAPDDSTAPGHQNQ